LRVTIWRPCCHVENDVRADARHDRQPPAGDDLVQVGAEKGEVDDAEHDAGHGDLPQAPPPPAAPRRG
jgi:hypothetical protein